MNDHKNELCPWCHIPMKPTDIHEVLVCGCHLKLKIYTCPKCGSHGSGGGGGC